MEQQNLNMRAITFAYALALIALGLVAYIGTGSAHVTALIPAFFGAVFLICAVLASNPKLKKHVMHVAVLLALIGVFGTAKGLLNLPALLSGAELERPAAVAAQAVMAVLSILFIVLAVKSFINARVRA